MKTPNLIHQSGLAQAVVFLRSREKKIGETFVNALASEKKIGETFVNALASVYSKANPSVKSGEALMKMALTEASLQSYMVLTADVADVAAWMRRFAQIELKQEEGGQ